MGSDLNDDVERLFACFKCGVSPPESALKERRNRPKKPRKLTPGKGESSSVSGNQNTPPEDKLGAPTSLAIKLKSGKQHISPIIFYGSPHGAPVKRPSQLLRLLHEIRFDLREQDDLVPRQDVWATFPRQEEAIKFAKIHTQSKIFSYQDHWSGQRRFLVSTYDEFWRRYTSMDSKFRHHYEVIQEGLPCHLYFDLEFNKKVNTDRDVDEMVDILISMTLNALFDKYSIKGNEEWIIELDSSTDEKFSRHLIVRIPKTAFKDNIHAGAFVAEICSRIGNLRGSDPLIDKLYICKESSFLENERHLFLDSAVYSRNRCFRLALSSKAGKSSFLLPTRRFKCKNMSDQQVFLESLICRMDNDCDKLLICKLDLDCKKTLCFDSEVHKQNVKIPQDVALSACRTDLPNSYHSGKSPFPSLDAFVESVASSGNVTGIIRCWYWFSADGLMIYSMLRNRYCERIGREHKSNHVMYIIDFQRAGYYQKCYDPDCKGYRSPMRQLPWNVVPDSLEIFNSTRTGDYKETESINDDLQHNENNLGYYLCDNNEWNTGSCDRESSWWQEAMKYADCIENTEYRSSFQTYLDVDEDSRWWMDAEKIASQVEERIGSSQ